MLIIALLLVSEFAAIRKSDEQAASDRKKQDESFELVLKKEDESFKQTLQGFRDQTTHATTILGTAQRVANIAKTNLENLTGGDSYAYMAPQFPTEAGTVPLAIVNVGNYPLTGVTVVATDSTELPFKTFPAIVVGTLSAHAVRRIDMFLLPNPEASKGPLGVASFTIDIYAQNGSSSQLLQFRHGKKMLWDYRSNLVRLTPVQNSFLPHGNPVKTTFGSYAWMEDRPPKKK